MKNIAVIPARFAASRFPGKLMQRIGEKTIIRMVYENAVAMHLFDEVLVDRIAEAIASMDVGVVVNIQGDEPFVEKEPLQDLLMCFEDPSVAVASVMKRFGEGDEPENPNQVKVVCNKNNDALYFSRSPIPFKRNRNADLPYFKHVGVYAYRKETLLSFTQWPMGALEQTEMLEQLRYLENGVAIRMVETKTNSIGIDTPEDLERARIEYRASPKGF